MSASPECATTVRTTLQSELTVGSLEVPLLPQVATEVLSSSLDDQSNAQRLAALIEKDQGLASHIMRVVNSPGFRGSTDIVSLKQAIARLGMERIREIALTISVKSTLFKPGPFEDLVASAWEFGLTTALWAKEVARQSRKNVETAYLCGLLHNVGVPILVNRIDAMSSDLTQEEVIQISAEMAPTAGAMLIGKWHLPSFVATCITGLSGKSPRPEQSSELSALQVVEASIILASTDVEKAPDPKALGPLPEFQVLNFYPDDMVELIDRRDVVAETVAGMK